MAVAASSFDAWLSEKLRALNTDESVFGTYIKGILEGDETEDEKIEALESIIAGITVSNQRALTQAVEVEVRMRRAAAAPVENRREAVRKVRASALYAPSLLISVRTGTSRMIRFVT